MFVQLQPTSVVRPSSRLRGCRAGAGEKRPIYASGADESRLLIDAISTFCSQLNRNFRWEIKKRRIAQGQRFGISTCGLTCYLMGV